MLTFKGSVLSVDDRLADFHDKDENGNKLPTTHKTRITTIVLLVPQSGSVSRPLICKGFGLPDDFKLPKQGVEWETPEIQSYQAKFKAIPECNIN